MSLIDTVIQQLGFSVLSYEQQALGQDGPSYQGTSLESRSGSSGDMYGEFGGEREETTTTHTPPYNVSYVGVTDVFPASRKAIATAISGMAKTGYLRRS
jgi:hypothetical protein